MIAAALAALGTVVALIAWSLPGADPQRPSPSAARLIPEPVAPPAPAAAPLPAPPASVPEVTPPETIEPAPQPAAPKARYRSALMRNLRRAGGGGTAATPGATAGTGTLTIQSIPWSRVYVDGRLIGTTPIVRQRVAPGRHVIRLEAPDGSHLSRTVVVQPGQNVPIRAQVRGLSVTPF